MSVFTTLSVFCLLHRTRRGFIFYLTFFLSLWILNLLLNTSLIPALLLCKCILNLLNVVFLSLSLSPLAWILQESHLLPDNAKAPGGEDSQGWALSVQSGISAWGATEKVLDHKLDRDAALLLLMPLFWTLNHSPSHWFDTGQTTNIGLVRATWTLVQCMDRLWIVLSFKKNKKLFQCNMLNVFVSEIVFC